LFKKKILYKVEGSEKIGMGHVFRSYYLIKNLKKKNIVIILTKKNSKSEFFFKQKKFKVVTYQNANEYIVFKKIINKFNIKKFVNDVIFLNKEIKHYLIKNNFKSYFLDTINVKAGNNMYCINTFIMSNSKHKNYYSGLKYVIKNSDLKFRKQENNIKNKLKIVFHFGGSDDKKLNIKILKILSSYKYIKSLSIILGPSIIYKLGEIKNIIKDSSIKCRLYVYPKKLNPIYNNTNLAIISGGNTLFNFCSALITVLFFYF
jgi:spore coat polysaccharide biosynthesis predicted glycosyltransferase SpsG